MNHHDARPDEKDRSQFGAYAYAARAELNGSGHGAEGHRHLSDDVSDDTKDQSGDQSDVEVAFANNNTAPSRRGESDVVILPATANGGHKPVRAAASGAWTGSANGSMNGSANGSANGTAGNLEAVRAASKPPKPVVSEANVIALPFADPLYGNGARTEHGRDDGRSGQTTVTMTRETATFTLPASEATLPAALLAAAGSSLSQRGTQIAQGANETASQSYPAAAATLVPPPLPTQPATALTPPPLPASAATKADEDAAYAISQIDTSREPNADLDFSGDFDDDEFDVFYTIHEEDEEATRSIAHRLKPASRA